MKNFVTINDQRMEVLQKGRNGAPILILTGMGCSFEEWFDVTRALSETNKIIMFHRPGLGESEIGEEPRTTAATAQEMNQLLEALAIQEPVVVVGHSYGGLCAQHFSKLYPEKVKGLLLVDSTSHDLERLDELELPNLMGSDSDEEWRVKFEGYVGMDEEALKKIIHPELTENQKKLPFPIQKQLVQFQQQPNLYKAMLSEVDNWKIDAKKIKSLGPLDDIPLVTLGRDKEYVVQQGIRRGFPESELSALENMWQQLILEQGELSKNSAVRFAERAGHSIHLDRPDLVVSIIKELAAE